MPKTIFVNGSSDCLRVRMELGLPCRPRPVVQSFVGKIESWKTLRSVAWMRSPVGILFAIQSASSLNVGHENHCGFAIDFFGRHHRLLQSWRSFLTETSR